ncbi:MAG TPA: hypothetical protein VGJ05_01185 [Fimbriiglobus sp.]|jgi:hypothetical protein
MKIFAHGSDGSDRSYSGLGDIVGAEIRDLFELTRPPEPSESEWDRVHRSMAESMTRPGSPWRTVALSVAAGIALAVGAITCWPAQPPANPGPEVAQVSRSEPADELASFPLATEDDVEIHSIRGDGWKSAVLGRSAMTEEISWAGPNDIQVKSSAPDEYYGAEPKLSGGTHNMPVIWADDSLRVR